MRRVSVVVLTMGDRPDALRAAIDSARSQAGVEVEVIVIGNGCHPAIEAPGVRVIASDSNVGVAAGRNLGWEAATAPVVLFLDDDARYGSEAVAATAAARFAVRSELAVMSFRILDEGGRVISKHIPMLWKANSGRTTDVTTFLGGACAVRRSVWEQVGGFPPEFFYALEETDLAWRVLDHGGAIEYAGDLEVIHPSLPLSLRQDAIRNTARSRILLARRRLPVPLAVVYLAVRGLMSLGTVRSFGDIGALLGGYRAGFTDPIEARAPLRWRTAWKMLRLGRPPVI